MTLKEVIAHHRWAAENCDGEVRNEHLQMVGWLAELVRLKADNAKLRELVRDYHTFLALAELAQPIGHIIAAHGHPTLSVKALDERYRELGVGATDE